VVNPDKSGTRVVKMELLPSRFSKLEYSNIIKNKNPLQRSIFVVLKVIFSRNARFLLGNKLKTEAEIKKFKIVNVSSLGLKIKIIMAIIPEEALKIYWKI
tara:strand:+ start:724 stop:1023 length:300 start_codon:yes stop_codon:yes gene_type:complete